MEQHMTEFCDWTISNTLSVPAGSNATGDMAEAAYDAAEGLLPSDGHSLIVSGTPSSVTVTFTLDDASRELAESISADFTERLVEEINAQRSSAADISTALPC